MKWIEKYTLTVWPLVLTLWLIISTIDLMNKVHHIILIGWFN